MYTYKDKQWYNIFITFVRTYVLNKTLDMTTKIISLILLTNIVMSIPIIYCM